MRGPHSTSSRAASRDGPSSSVASPSGRWWRLRVGATDPRVGAVFVLGYPGRLQELPGPLDAGGRPCLFVQGENDTFGSPEALQELVETFPEGRSIVIVPGADHFFEGRLDELQGAVCTWAEGRPWESHGGTA